MCGRAKLPTDYSEIKIQLRFDDRFPAPNLKQSWNVAPTDPMLAAVRDAETGTRRPAVMHWGLIPWWSKEPKLKYATFNAKAETITTTASSVTPGRTGSGASWSTDADRAVRYPMGCPRFKRRAPPTRTVFEVRPQGRDAHAPKHGI